MTLIFVVSPCRMNQFMQKNSILKLSFFFLLFLQHLSCATDPASARSAITTNLGGVFKNVQGFGQCSRIVAAYHPSFDGMQLPFSVLASDYNNGSFTQVLKQSANTASNTTAAFVDTQSKFTNVKELDYAIDDFGGQPIFKMAVAAQPLPLILDNITLIDASGAVKDAASLAAKLESGYAAIGDTQKNVINKIVGFASPSRIFTRCSNILNAVTKGAAISTLPLNSTSFQSLVYAATSYNPSNSWIDYVPANAKTTDCLAGVPSIFKGELLVLTSATAQVYKTADAFRLDSASKLDKYASWGKTWENNPGCPIDLATRKIITPAVLQQRFACGQINDDDAFLLKLFNASYPGLRALAFNDGFIFWTSQGIFRYPMMALSDLVNVPSISPDKALNIPNFASYKKLAAAGSNNELYIAGLLNNGTFDVIRVGAGGVEKIVNIPTYAVDVAVTAKGHVAFVDATNYELWWANVVDAFTVSASVAQIQALQALSNGKDAIIADKETQLAAQQTQITALQAQEQNIRTKLNAALAAGTPGADTMTLEQELQMVLDQQQAKIDQANKTANDLLTQLSSKNADIANLTQANKDLLQAKQDLIAKHAQDLQRCDQTMAALQSSMAGLGIDSAALKVNLDASATDFAAQLKTLQDAISAAVALKNSKIACLEAANASLKAQLEDAQQEIEDLLAAAEADRANNSALMDSLNSTISTLNGSIATLTKTLEAKDKIISQQKDQIATLTKAADSYKSELDKIAALIVGPGVTFDTQTMLSNQSQSLFAKLQAVMAAKDAQINSLSQEVERQKNLAAQANNQLAQTQADLDKMKASYEASAKKSADLEKQLADLKVAQQQALDDKQKSIDSLNTINAGLKKSLEDMTAQRDSLQAKADKTAEDLAKEKSLTSQLQGQLTNLSNSLQAQKDAQAALQAQLEGFNSDLNFVLQMAGVTQTFSGTATQVMQQTIAALKTAVSKLNDTIKQQQSVIDAMTKERTAAVNNLTSLLKSNDPSITVSATASLNDLVNSYASQMQGILNAARDKAASEKADLTNQLANAAAQIKAIQAEKDTSAQNDKIAMEQKDGQIKKLEELLNQANADLKASSEAAAKATADYNKTLSEKQAVIDAMTARETALKAALDAELAKLGGTVAAGAPNTSILDNLKYVMAAKDSIIAGLKKDLADEQAARAKEAKDASDKIKALTTNNLNLSNTIKTLSDVNATLNKNLTDLQKQLDDTTAAYEARIAEKDQMISQLQAAESAVRAKVNALLSAQTGNLTADQQAAITQANGNLNDLMPVLTSLMNAKDEMIKNLQGQLKDRDDKIDALNKANAALQASLDQRTADIDAMKRSEKALSDRLAALAGQQIDGAIGTLQFSESASLQDRVEQLMEFRKQQMQQMRLQFETEKANLTASLATSRAALEAEMAKTKNLTDLSEQQKASIAKLQGANADLEARLADKTTQLQNTKNELQALVQQLQAQVDDLKSKNALQATKIEDLNKKINDQATTIEEKNKLIAQREQMAADYATALQKEQDKTTKLSADLMAEKESLRVAQDIITQKVKELADSQSAQDMLKATLQATIDEKAKVDALNKQQIDSLSALNAQRQARIDQLEKQQAVLVNQVDVLSGIIDKNINLRDLPKEDQDRLAAVMSSMGTDGNIVKMMLDGNLDMSQLDSYRVLWFCQDVRKGQAAYAAKLDEQAAAIIAEVYTVHTMLNSLNTDNGKSFADNYQALSKENQALVTKLIPDIATVLADANFKLKMASKTVALVTAKTIVDAITAWGIDKNADGTPNTDGAALKDEMLKILSGDPNKLQLSALQVKLNVIFEQKKVEMEGQQKAYDKAVSTMEATIEDTKKQLADAVANGQKNLAEAAAELKKLEDEKNQKLAEQKDLAQKLSDLIDSGAASISGLKLNIARKQSNQESQSKMLSALQTRQAKIKAQIAATRTAVTQGVADLGTLQALLAEDDNLTRVFEYLPYILPLAVKFDADGNAVIAGKQLDDKGKLVSVGQDQIGASESITISYNDLQNGQMLYINPASVTADGSVIMTSANRFDPAARLQVVNQANNTVSFEFNQNDKRMVLVLVKSSKPYDLPPAVQPYAPQIGNYDVKFVAVDKNATLSDEQKFYAEGLATPVSNESIIIRTCSSANNYANDMLGYLSVSEVEKGKFALVYKPWVSDEFHKRPGFGETTFVISQLDSASKSNEASLLATLEQFATLDKTKIVDANKGYTAYDKAFADFLASFAGQLSKIYKGMPEFHDFAILINDYTELRASKSMFTPKDLAQIKEFVKLFGTYIFAAGEDSNLPKTSAGYKLLFGQVDEKGNPVPNTGLINKEEIKEAVKLEDGDYVSLLMSDMRVRADLAAATIEKPILLSADNSLSRMSNMQLVLDAASKKFRILTHPSLGSFKLVANNNMLLFLAKDSNQGSDLFDLAGSVDALQIKSGDSFVSYDKDTKKFALVSDSAAAASFKAKASKKDSFRAKLVDLAGAPQDFYGNGVDKLAMDELNRDKTVATQTFADISEYIQSSVNDQNKADFSKVIQSLIYNIMNSEFAKIISKDAINNLNNTLSLFALNNAQYFLLKNSAGLYLRVGQVYQTEKTVVVNNQTQNITTFDLMFVPSYDYDKGCLVKIIPNPKVYGTYLLQIHQPETGATFFVAADDINVKTTDGATSLRLTAMTGSASSYDKDQSISDKANETFSIEGSMAQIAIKYNNGYFGVLDDGSVKRLATKDSSGAAFAKAGNVFALTAVSDFEGKLVLADIEQIANTLYNLMLDLDSSKDDAAAKSAKAEQIMTAFKNVTCDDSSGKLMLRQKWVTRGLVGIATQEDKGIYSVADVLSYIIDDFKYEKRNNKGINFTPATTQLITALKDVFVIKDFMSIKKENIDRVLFPENLDIAIFMNNNQKDLAKLRPAILSLVSFIAGRSVEFADATSINIKDFDATLIRTDMSDDVRKMFELRFQGMMSSGFIIAPEAKEFVTNMYYKFRPDVKVSDAAAKEKAAKPKTYGDLDLYDKLELAENMVSGYYRDLTGKMIAGKNIAEAKTILATISDADISAQQDAPSYKAWLGYIQDEIQAEERPKMSAGSLQGFTLGNTGAFSFSGFGDSAAGFGAAPVTTTPETTTTTAPKTPATAFAGVE